MPTIVDEFVTTLALDATAFKKGAAETEAAVKGLQENVNKGAKDIDASNKIAAQSFANVRNEALGLLGVLLGGKGLESFIRDTATSLSALGRAAADIGAPIGDVDAFGKAVARIGGDGGAAVNTMRNITLEMERFKMLGDPGKLPWMFAMGVTVDDSPLEALRKAATFADSHSRAQSLVTFQSAGFDEGTQQLLLRGRANLERELKESGIQGLTTPEMSGRMQQLQHDWIGLTQTLAHLNETMLTDAEPWMDATIKWMTNTIETRPKLVEGIELVTGAIVSLGLASRLASLFGLGALSSGISGLFGVLARLGLWTLPLAFVGGAGGEDPDFSRQKNDEYLRNHPSKPGDTWWTRVQRSLGMDVPQGSAPNTVPTAANRVSVMEETRAFWKSKGLSDAQVAGILSNAAAESSFNPENSGIDTNGLESAGLFQWQGPRLAALRAKYGLHPTVAQQNQFAYDELTAGGPGGLSPSVWQNFTASTNERTAGANWSRGFEVAGGASGNMNVEAARRGQGATQYLSPSVPRAPGAAFGGARGSSSATTSIGTVVVNTQATDAKGIAKDLHSELSSQANRGLS